jgi:hypothetical protein
MGELGDILGDEFEDKYEEKRKQAREEATKVGKKMLMEICYEAIKNEGFKGEEPRFRFSGENLDHDVLLMESPQRDLQKFRHQLGEDAMSMGMFHVDTLFSLAFQSNMIELIDRIEEDEYYLVVGQYEENIETSGDGSEEVYYNINPVRGILPLNVAKDYADKFEEEMQGTSIEEQAKDQESEEDTTQKEDDSDIDLGGTEVDTIDESEIIQVFQGIGNKAPEILESVAEGDSTAMDKLTTVTNNNIEGEASKERILDVFEDNVEPIEGRGEEEDEDGLDLGGIGETDSVDGGESGSSDEAEPAAPTSDGDVDSEVSSSQDESDGDDDSTSSDPSDWF